ncbi:hypothetical protein [Peterkaempfera bronchialis]|uniref:hypothetical protein n=1 Tax=Peterkaempfera bronchialis TaxID=2126346 RepID=UPI003C2D9271
MKRRTVATLILAGPSGLATVTATGVRALSGGLYGCTGADRDLAPTLASLPILGAGPDDGFACAGQS